MNTFACLIEFDPNPLLSLTKRRRRNSEKSVDSKDRRVSADSSVSFNVPVAPVTLNNKEQMEAKIELSQAEVSCSLLLVYNLSDGWFCGSVAY